MERFPVEKLLKVYHNELSKEERLILQICAYCFVKLSPAKIGPMLSRSSSISMPAVAKAFQTLRSKGLLLTKTAANEYELPREILLVVLAEALQDVTFVKYIPQINVIEHQYRWNESSYRHLRNLFVKHFLQKEEDDVVSRAQYYVNTYFDYLYPVLGDPAFNWLFLELGSKALYHLLQAKLTETHADLLSTRVIEDFDVRLLQVPGLIDKSSAHYVILTNYYLLNGDFEAAEQQIANIPVEYRNNISFAVIKLYRGETEDAYNLMHQFLDSQKKSEMFVNYEIYYCIYYILALLSLEPEKYMLPAQKMLAVKNISFNYSNLVAYAMLSHATGHKEGAAQAISRAYYFASSVNDLENIFLYIAACYTESLPDVKYFDDGKKLLEKALSNGYKLLALELSYSLATLYKTEDFENIYQKLSSELKQTALLSRKPRHEDWELTLNSFISATALSGDRKEKITKATRVIYFVDLNRGMVQPTLQTITPSGGWTKGRNIALKRLKDSKVEGMSEQDHRIAGTIKTRSNYWDGNHEYFFDEDVFPVLAGHPYLFLLNNPDIPIELVKAPPTITVEKTDTGYILKSDAVPNDKDYVILKETNTQYKLVTIDQHQRSILQSITRDGFVIPEEGKEKLLQALEGMSSSFTIHSDMIESAKGTRVMEGDSRIRVQLLPLGNTLKAELFVKPFDTVPPYCKPGQGGQTIIGTIDNERCQAMRDLKKESRYANAILDEIQQNTNIDVSQDLIVFEDPRDSLYLLEILTKHQDIVVVEWPEGARFKIRRSVSMSNINLEVKGVDYWFEVDGDLKVDDQTVLTVKQLLDLNAKSYGKFIELGNGEFIALSNDLKKRLDELQTYTSQSDKKVKLNRFASIPLFALFEQAGSFKSDTKWKDFQQMLANAKVIQPEIPKTLLTELRPYQEEGFRWMVRLSAWNAGACLADDMGLGKTIQALALLLYRAKQGPALVVCPASVMANWVSETQKFAPTLHMTLLNGTNRKGVIEKADAFDIVLTTYGLMQSEDKMFARKKWTTVILDEAHAIKNYHTKTSKAAMNLSADFRLILTGTPVQNHLGEVWNLFNFINPGLLGTMQQFNDRFVKTGEKGSKRLKKLVTPFILRRTKNSVLEELPPKTEIVKQVELSDDERVFYEAIRRRAIENLQNASGHAGQQHVKALAEITRLRLACCNAELVEANIKIPSSKLTSFMEIIDELRGNNHRALVFSQFVKHLDVVRKALDEQKIRYKYLDGSTSLSERERNVRDFQSGDGELFLISLKAGGLGLNLTAADYVIHLDPWWNPAVEDQASDRAHRIGQQRPVTIYRLVTQHTIEEKILQLHHTKRDIADSLLEGTDSSAKLSTEELLKLILEE